MSSLVAVTGASGFIGGALCDELYRSGFQVRGIVRSSDSIMLNPRVEYSVIGNIGSNTAWAPVLKGVDCLVHCASYHHARDDRSKDALVAYRDVNVSGTLNLARQAASAGVQRFVFISSIKVMGEVTLPSKPFTEECVIAPQDPYGQSKFDAEKGLVSLASETDMEVVIIRPPLVYGPGVKGNFLKLVEAVKLGLPLPFGSVQNQRSLMALDNLVSLMMLCVDRNLSPKAANQVFVVADGEDVSTTVLLQKMARAAGRPSRLISFPGVLLRASARVFGKKSMANRLLDNLQVDARKAQRLLGWRPTMTMDEQLAIMFATSTSNDRPLIRALDLMFSATGLILLSPFLLLVLLFSLLETRSPLFTQTRVGRHQRPFKIIKFRTMRLGTLQTPSHLASSASITRLGMILRLTKVDELPQLWNVLLGQMSLVGPRPGLYSQHQLIKARASRGVYAARPGITGLAQINGIDMSTPELLAQTDARMLRELNLATYCKYIFMTARGKVLGDGIKK